MADEIDFNAEEKKDNTNEKMEELGLDDLSSRYVKHPGVGEEIVIEVAKAYKDKNVTAKNKQGETFSTALSGVNYKITIECKDGSIYSPTSWEVWNKIRNLMQDKKSMQLKVSIKHLIDGSNATGNVEKIAKLNDLTVEEATELQKKAQEAKLKKMLYEVKLVE